MASRIVEIFCVRNEILLGETLDTNSHWLCSRLTQMGARVRRVVQLPSSRDNFVEEYRRFLAHESDLLITVGGLGPTDEDNTLNFVSAATERPFEISNVALELVQRRYEELHEGEKVDSARLNELRKKMAYMPRGGRPVENPLGVAPAMLLAKKSGSVLSLPGVPEELMAVFEGPQVATYLGAVFSGSAYAQETLIVKVRDEAQLLPAMRFVRKRHEDIHVGAQSFRDEQGLRFHVYLYAFAGPADDAPSPLRGSSEGSTTSSAFPAFLSAGGSSDFIPAIGTSEISVLNVEAHETARKNVEAAVAELKQELDNEGIEYYPSV